MAHFAQIDADNIVVRVLVVPDEQEHRGQDFLANELGLGGTWIQTSINTARGEHLTGKAPLRKNYAMVDGTYDPDRDAFIPVKPYPSWLLDEDTCCWKAPIDPPQTNNALVWNEQELKWNELSMLINPGG